MAERVNDVSNAQVKELMEEYQELYDFTEGGRLEGSEREAIGEQARIEIGLKAFLQEGIVRMMKIMAENKGTSFMEDYTYHMQAGNQMVLGAHMLEICPTLAANNRKLKSIHCSLAVRRIRLVSFLTGLAV